MKNIGILAFLLCFTLFACKAKKDDQSTGNQPSTEAAQEIKKLETEIKDLNTSKEEIENLSDEVDALLKELD